MKSQPTADAGIAERPASLLALAVWVGIITGFGELARIGLVRGDVPIERSRDMLWMVPAFDAGLFAVLGVVVALIASRVRIPWRVAAGFFVGLGAFLILQTFGSLHALAAVVAATGVGTLVARVLEPRVPVFSRLVGRSLPWLAGSVVVLGVATVGWRVVAERRLVHSRPTAARGAPNILLLILDTVRAADLSLYGFARSTTPELEHFAQGATVFDRAFSTSSWTFPSHASIFTGHWAFAVNLSCRDGLGPEMPTLAEALRGLGYATTAFVANTSYAGWESGFTRGFEHYHDYPIALRTAAEATAFGKKVYPRLRRVLTASLRRVPLLWRLRWPPPQRFQSADEITGSFLAWLDRGRPAPFFAFLNFMDAHPPYTAPDSFRYRFRSPILRPVSPWAWSDTPPTRLTPADLRPKQDMYDGSIAYLDSQLGRLFRELDRRGLLDNTLVIVVADHGEEFAEHGVVNHGNTLYHRSLHVPLIVRFPGRVPQGRRVTQRASLRNLAATVLDLVGPSPTAELPGRSLARFWAGPDTMSDTIVASVHQTDEAPSCFPGGPGDLTSIALGEWRYIRRQGDTTEELYDFDHDLLERWNLVESEAGRRLLPRYRAALGAVTTSAKGEN
jgi:arylsulfatase A-like enzyme